MPWHFLHAFTIGNEQERDDATTFVVSILETPAQKLESCELAAACPGWVSSLEKETLVAAAASSGGWAGAYLRHHA